MPYNVKDLVFRLKLSSPTQAALRLEDNAGKFLGEAEFECGRTSGTTGTEIIGDTALDELMEELRTKLGS